MREIRIPHQYLPCLEPLFTRLRISYNLKHLNCTSPFLSLKGFYELDTLCRMPTLPHRQAALKGIDRELAHSASAPRTKSTGSSTSTSAFDAKSCSVGTGRVPRPTSMLATRVTLMPCSPHPLASSNSSSACPTPNTCDLYFALDKTSSFMLVASDNQPIQSTS